VQAAEAEKVRTQPSQEESQRVYRISLQACKREALSEAALLYGQVRLPGDYPPGQHSQARIKQSGITLGKNRRSGASMACRAAVAATLKAERMKGITGDNSFELLEKT
jgi:hypothetical protein